MIYKTHGVCSQEINFDVQDNKLTNVRFIGGCSGNTQGLGRLIEGMDVVDAIAESYVDYADRPQEDMIMKSVTVETFGEEYPDPEKI